jgi:hypothetical protein
VGDLLGVLESTGGRGDLEGRVGAELERRWGEDVRWVKE